MKRITAMLLAVACLLSLCACGGDKTADVSAKDLVAATMNSVKPDNADTLAGSDDQAFTNKFWFYYGVEVDKVSDYAIAYSSEAKSDEISVLKAASGTDVKTLVKALEVRRDMQVQTFERYSPESVELLKNAEIFSKGDYAVMIVAANAADIRAKLEALLGDAGDVSEQSKDTTKRPPSRPRRPRRAMITLSPCRSPRQRTRAGLQTRHSSATRA